MKKFIKIAYLNSILTFIAGCGYKNPNVKEPKIHEYGFLKYIFKGENSAYQLDYNDKSVVIVGFTDEGLQQECIDIPNEIDGHAVTNIGLKDSSYSHEKSKIVEVSKESKIKKIFFDESIVDIDYFYGEDVKLINCSEKINFKINGIQSNGIYVCEKIYDSLLKYEKEIYKLANVSFFQNFLETNDLYRIDIIQNNEKINKPNNPYREGYSFAGWFLEPECVNGWDFDTVLAVDDGLMVNLYAGWTIL